MRRLAIVLAVICAFGLFASSAFAIDAGKWRVGGGAAGSYLSADIDASGAPTMSYYNLTGEVGYFVISNLELGLGLTYLNASSGSGDDLTATIIRPYGKYYFPSGDNAWYAGLGYDMSTIDTGGSTSPDLSGFFLLGGYSIKVASGASVDLQVGYEMGKAEAGSSVDINIMGIGASFSLWL